MSGLYKLMEVNARLCCKLDYFKVRPSTFIALLENVCVLFVVIGIAATLYIYIGMQPTEAS